MNLLNTIQYTGLPPIIKWAGGKEKELPVIFDNAPPYFENYYEPFVGGGSVFTAFTAKHYYINDKSEELINLYLCVANKDIKLYNWLEDIMNTWQAMLDFADCNRLLCSRYYDYRNDKISDDEMKGIVLKFLEENNINLDNILSYKFKWNRDSYREELKKNLTRKIVRMKKIERQKHVMPGNDIFDNIETALMSSIYMYFRGLYNDIKIMKDNKELRTALFVFIRNYAYSGMFRYNKDNKFNVPYGGIGYNHKTLKKKVQYYKSKPLLKHFSKTSIYNMDFEEFLNNNPPQRDDFVFLDPPYDSDFSTYAQNEFTQSDQLRLARYLINDCKAKWMLVIKSTPYICSIYANKRLSIKKFDKKYLVSFMNRNDKNAEHLIVKNY